MAHAAVKNLGAYSDEDCINIKRLFSTPQAGHGS